MTEKTVTELEDQIKELELQCSQSEQEKNTCKGRDRCFDKKTED